MPCYDPSPTDRDYRAIEAAHCIIILFNKLNKPIPEVVKIPKGYDELSAHKNLDLFTNILCESIRALTKEQLEAIVYNGRDKGSRRLAEWWDNHQEIDKKRE